MHALVDCNNFFVSCERVFRPDLWDKPCAVLSSNDGCVVARSNDVKAMGVGMGAPYFKHKSILKKNKVSLFSSNFMLYGDMSERVMSVLSKFTHDVDVYSVDEAFLDFTGIEDMQAHATEIKNKVWQWTGMPVTVGVGKSKTLAKVAAEVAKKNSEHRGVLVLENQEDTDIYLSGLHVSDLWGIGPGYTKQLKNFGVETAYDLVRMDDALVKKHLGVGGLHVVWELRGKSIDGMDRETDIPKSMIRSRSFGKRVTSSTVLKEAVAMHVSNAARKLREQELTAGFLKVYVMTSRFNDKTKYYGGSGSVGLFPTDNTFELMRVAMKLTDKIYREGYEYAKAGVMLLQIQPKKTARATLFEMFNKKSDNLLRSMDRLNDRYGRHTLRLGSMGTDDIWEAKHSLLSPAYTSRWGDVPVVKA
jgi:DNA polymerase V